jgi:flavocytochrome c
MTELNRRKFLGASAALSLGGIASAASAKALDPVPAKWDESVDVIVVGSGFAGLAAAIEAKNAGANVIVLEKMRALGGNSTINGGIMAVPASPMQQKNGIKDSPAQLAEDMIREGAGLNNPEKVKTLVEQALPTWQWTKDELGVEWNLDKLVHEGGHAVPRCAVTANGSGSAIVTKEIEKCKALGVPLRLRVFMEQIIRDTDGRVKGLKVREGYKFPDKTSGKVKYIEAKKGVVLAYGGFSADVKYRMLHDPKLTDKFQTTNQPGATSEGWREANRIGCHIVQADWIQCGPWNSPDEKGMGIALYFAQSAAASFGVWLNTATGKRFVDELANRKVRADAIMSNANKGEPCIAVADQNGVDQMGMIHKGMLAKQLERGVVLKFDTLEALAKEFKIPMAGLQKTIDEYNAGLKAGKDPLGRYINKDCKPLTQGPWYASKLSPKVHHCMGGIVTNMKGQALDCVTDEPIPGLYAAGEATGGVHGAVRLGSCATLDCLVNGRICGKNVAA